MAVKGNNLTQSRREADVAEKVRLGDVVRIDTSTPFPEGDKVWLLNLDMIEQHTGRVIDHVEVERGSIGGSTVGFDKDCILYSKLRPNLNKVVIPDREGVATSEILPLRCKSNNNVREFISWYLRSPTFVSYAMSRTAGAKMPRLGSKELLNAKIPVPSFTEQKRIAAVLDKICELKKNAETRLEKLDALVKSRFVEMFEEGNFNSRPLSENVLEMFIGPFGSSLKNECFVERNHSYCMVYEQKHTIRKTLDVETRYVNKAKYEELKRFSVGAGDILVSCRGTVGEVYALPPNAPVGIMHPSIMKIRINERVYDQTYFVFALRRFMRDHLHLANGSGVKMAITAKALGCEMFYLPPLALQREFAAFVAKVDKLREVARQTVKAMDTLYRAKLQEFFG